MTRNPGKKDIGTNVLIDDLQQHTERGRKKTGHTTRFFCRFQWLAGENAKTEFYQHDAHWSNRMILGEACKSWPRWPNEKGPFKPPLSGRIAVKVINHLGDEVMKVFRVL
ncbi:MAG TPA: hypothetical protein VK186_03460 [Candidatus Deferrimicrobium sp.]|nr:hypothetical protein [Candidatus Kapabacteria bacterium]HLP57855.1 hypothetical protein [Candidatus Deferrimicrobium sp.]